MTTFNAEFGQKENGSVLYLTLSYGEKSLVTPVLGAIDPNRFVQETKALIELCNSLLEAKDPDEDSAS